MVSSRQQIALVGCPLVQVDERYRLTNVFGFSVL